jgi:thiol-disulfide isomerase/thioredoxin
VTGQPGATPTPGSSAPRAGWSSRRWYAVAGVALALAAVIGVVVASQSSPSSVTGAVDLSHLPVGGAAPELRDATAWLNGPPLTNADLHGKVVLYDFWTYSCINCVRTIPHLRAWYDRYRSDGLVVVGVHSPEFDFEKDPGNVSAAVRNLRVDYPVALDDNMDIWNAFGNQYWPEQYVADRQGHVRFQHVGEGGDTDIENVLRKLLGVPASAARAGKAGTAGFGQPPSSSDNVTQESYLGLDKGVANAQAGTVTYPNVGELSNGDVRLVGPWTASAEQVQAAGPGAAIVLGERARSVNLVMATATGGPVNVVVALDGKPLPPAYRTSETQVDAHGQTFITVSASDLYRLVLGPRVEGHTVRLTAQAPGVQAFAFTFGA